MTKEELNKHFVEWFYNSNWVEGYNRNGWMRDHFNNQDADARHYWMLEAFQAGFELWHKLEQQDWDEMMDSFEQLQPLPPNWPFPEPDMVTPVTQFASKAAWPFPEESTT